MQIRSASYEDAPAIQKMWSTLFQDPDEYIQLYLKERFDPNFTAILEDDREVVGMIHLLPCMLSPNQKAFYWYAAGIREEFHNRGYFRMFTQKILHETQRLGYANFCVPAPGLERVYQKYGFTYPFHVTECYFTGAFSSQRYKISSATPEDFLTAFPEKGSTKWGLSSIQYAFLENEFCGGCAIKISNDKESYVALAIKKDFGYLIDSTNLTVKTMERCQNAVLDYLNCEKVLFRSTADNPFDSNTKIFGLSDCSLINEQSKLAFSLS